MIKKIILTLLLIIILAVGGLAAYISFMDWNTYKGRVAEELSAATGVKVNINGNVSGALFPQPHISLTQVSLNDAQSGAELAKAAQIDTDVSLSSLLSGTPDITSLNVKEAEIWLKIDENGQTNWHQDIRPKFLSGSVKTKLQKMNLENAVIHFNAEKYQTELDLNDVNLELSATELSGPYSILGNFKKAEERFAISVMMGSVMRIEEIDLNFSIVHESSKSELRFDGQYNMENFGLNGDFSGDFAQFADLINILAGKEILTEEYNKKLVFSVSADINSEGVNLSRLVLKYEPFIEGSGDIYVKKAASEGKPSEADIQYQFVDLDSRPLLQIISAYFADYQGEQKYEPDFSWDVKFNLTAEHMQISENASGFLESVSIKGNWKENALTLEELSAMGPGNIILAVNGSLVEKDSKPEYYAQVSIEGKNLLTFIKALNYDVSAPTKNAYRDANIHFEISGTPQNLKLSEIKFDVDKVSATGEVIADLLEHKIQTKLDVGNINLDNYLSTPEVENNPEAWLRYFISQLAPLQNYAAEIEFSANEVVSAGFPLQNVIVRLSSSSEGVSVDLLRIDNFMHSTIRANAKLKGLDTENPQIEMLAYDITAQNFSELAPRLKLKLPECALFDKPATIEGSFRGNLQKADAYFAARFNDTKIRYVGVLTKEKSNYEYDGIVNVDVTNMLKFLRDVNLTPPEKNELRVPLNAQFKIKGKADDMNFTDMAVRLGTAEYKGSGNLKKAEVYQLTADIEADEFVLDNVIYLQNTSKAAKKDNLFMESFLSRPNLARDYFDFEPYRKLDLAVILRANKIMYNKKIGQNFSGKILNGQNVIKIQDVAFSVGDADYQGNIQINYEQNPQFNGHIDVQGENIDWRGKDYGLLLNALNASMDLSAPFNSFEDMFNNVSGNIIFNSGEMTIYGVDLSAIERDLQERKYAQGLFQVVQSNLQRGTTEFESIGGNINMNNGVLEFKDTSMHNDFTDLFMEGKLSLNEWKMNTNFRVKYKNLPDLPEYFFSFSGMMNKPTLDVNIEALVQDYETHRAEIEKAEEAKKAAEHQKLMEQIDELQQKIDDVEMQNQTVAAELENYSALTDVKESKDKYENLQQKLQQISSEVAEIQSKIRLADVTSAEIAPLTDKSQKFVDSIETIAEKLPDLYAQDLTLRKNNAYAQAKKLEEDGAQLSADYQRISADTLARLKEIGAEAYMLENPNMKRWQAEFTEGQILLQQLQNDFRLKDEALGENVQITETQLQDFNDMNAQQHNILQKMRDTYVQTEAMLKSLLDERLKIKALEAEKNKNNLLFTKDEPKVAKNPEIKDMNFEPINVESNEEKGLSENEVNDEYVENKANSNSVEDDSGNALKKPSFSSLLKKLEDDQAYEKSVSGKLRRSYDKEESNVVSKKTSGLLKPLVDGEIQTSGTITVK